MTIKTFGGKGMCDWTKASEAQSAAGIGGNTARSANGRNAKAASQRRDSESMSG